MAQDLIDRFTPLHTQPINDAGPIATWAILNGHRALKFSQALGQAAYFASVLSSLYNSSGILATLVWSTAGTTAGTTFTLAFEQQASGVFAYTGASFGIAKSVVVGAVSANVANYSTISFSNAEIDGLAALESYRIQLTRTDLVAQDAYVHRVFLQNLT